MSFVYGEETDVWGLGIPHGSWNKYNVGSPNTTMEVDLLRTWECHLCVGDMFVLLLGGWTIFGEVVEAGGSTYGCSASGCFGCGSENYYIQLASWYGSHD
jgi:hypothetical protein